MTPPPLTHQTKFHLTSQTVALQEIYLSYIIALVVHMPLGIIHLQMGSQNWHDLDTFEIQFVGTFILAFSNLQAQVHCTSPKAPATLPVNRQETSFSVRLKVYPLAHNRCCLVAASFGNPYLNPHTISKKIKSKKIIHIPALPNLGHKGLLSYFLKERQICLKQNMHCW